MSNGIGSTKLYVTVLIFSLLMPVISFALTTWEDDVEDYEIAIDPDVLMMAGITLSDGITLNVTYQSAFVYFEFENQTIRTKWTDTWSLEPNKTGFGFETQGVINKWLDNWWYPYHYKLRPQSEASWRKIATNLTILSNFEPEWNYSRFILEDGYQVFFTPYDPSENLSFAIYDSAHLNCTIGKTLMEDGASFSFMQFMNWYWSLMIGSNSFGLPTFMSWIVRLISALTLLSGVLLAKEMLRL